MNSKRQLLCVNSVILALSLSAGLAQSGQMRRAYTVDDMLKIEGIGALEFGPDETSIIFEYQSPYDERGEYGVERGGHVLRLSLSGKQEAKPLFEHEANAKYWLGNTSPNGGRLLIFKATRQETRIGVYEFETNRLTLVEEILQLNERFERNNPVWINDEEIVFSARSEESIQYEIRDRPQVAYRTSALRERAFAGETSVASISTAPPDHWHDGYLLRYNVRTKRVSILGAGRFGNLKLSADGKKLAALRLGQRLLHFPVDQLTDYYLFDTQLYIFDFESDSSKSFLPNSQVKMGSLRWSITGSNLSYFAWNRMKTMDQGTHYVTVLDTGSSLPIHIDGFTYSWRNRYPRGTLREPVAAEWLQKKLIVHGVLNTSHLQDIEQTSSVNVAVNREAKWYEVDLETMAIKTAIIDGNQPNQVHRFRDGRLLLHSDQAIFIASDSTIPIPLNIENSDSIQIMNGGWDDEIEDMLVYTASTEGNLEFGFLDLTRNEVAEPMTQVVSQILAWAPDTQQVIVRADTEAGGALYLQRPGKAPMPLLTFNEHLSEVEHPRWDTIVYRGANGVGTFSCVLLPYNYDPQTSYPTVVDVYPGIGKDCGDESGVQQRPLGRNFWGMSIDILSANGYLVVRPSNTYELNQDNGTQFGGLKTQVDAVLDTLVAAGMTDPERIGLWGFSDGSLASLWLASVSNRYKAVIPMFGASSPHIEYFGGSSLPAFELYIDTPIGHLVTFESERGVTPLSMGRSAVIDPLGYIKASPLDRAKYICSPVMMVHSDLDGNFTPYHYEAFLSAMYRLGKRAELVRYYGEGHGLSSPRNIRDFYDRVLNFLGKHVASGAPMTACNSGTIH